MTLYDSIYYRSRHLSGILCQGCAVTWTLAWVTQGYLDTK